MSTLTLHTAAAEAFAAQLPTQTPTVAAPGVPPLSFSNAVIGSFVGSISASVAVVLTDPSLVTAAAAAASAGAVETADLLQPSFEAATAHLGAGVLNVSSGDAQSLFDDHESATFSLTSQTGDLVGAIAIRISDNARERQSNFTGNFKRINDVEMALTVEIGRTRISVRNTLALVPGEVIELDRSAGAPADVLLNGKLIAHGEVVVQDQDYAVRITKIVDEAEGSN